LAPLAVGFTLLFVPPADLTGTAAAIWLAATLIAAYLGYSLASIAYQAWGAELAHDDAGRARVTTWREAACSAFCWQRSCRMRSACAA
jgi:Na+/melibiose symporter-like transporter